MCDLTTLSLDIRVIRPKPVWTPYWVSSPKTVQVAQERLVSLSYKRWLIRCWRSYQKTTSVTRYGGIFCVIVVVVVCVCVVVVGVVWVWFISFCVLVCCFYYHILLGTSHGNEYNAKILYLFTSFLPFEKWKRYYLSNHLCILSIMSKLFSFENSEKRLPASRLI